MVRPKRRKEVRLPLQLKGEYKFEYGRDGILVRALDEQGCLSVFLLTVISWTNSKPL